MPKKASPLAGGNGPQAKSVKGRKAKQEPGPGKRRPTRKVESIAEPDSFEPRRSGFDSIAQLLDDDAILASQAFQPKGQDTPSSREGLQSLTAELAALNERLQETMDQQQTTSGDLRNILYSTKTATLFLDHELRIRFFTPETKAIFSLLPADIGRPLVDLRSLADDDGLLTDAVAVLADGATIEREIRGTDHSWFQRRIFAYFGDNNAVCGVVITYVDVTKRRVAADLIDVAIQASVKANRSKSRFLAVASQGLRQPLQALTLIHGMLRQAIEDGEAEELIDRSGLLLGAMGGMLNSLVDVNQIEAGLTEVAATNFDADELFDRLREEFEPLAQMRGIELRVIPSGVTLLTDPRLLEVIIRNLLSNALENTKPKGRILLGCRLSGNHTRIEVRDTGVGIAEDQLDLIFGDFYQIEVSGDTDTRSLGLGLTIVRELARLLDHEVKVQSWPGRGSLFSVMVPRGAFDDGRTKGAAPSELKTTSTGSTIALVEDDSDVREVLQALLTKAGHTVICANDGPGALEMVSEEAIRPDLVVTEYILPGGMNGMEMLTRLRANLEFDVPCLVLTKDSSIGALATAEVAGCLLLQKPVVAQDLHAAIRELTPHRRPSGRNDTVQPSRLVCVIKDKPEIRATMRGVLEYENWPVSIYPDAEAFLEAENSRFDQCLIIDTDLPEMSGLALIEHLRANGKNVPAILITATGDIAAAVKAMRSGASDFIERPVGRQDLVESIKRAVSQVSASLAQERSKSSLARWPMALTPRQQVVLDLVMTGAPSKNIAADLGISQRTVEVHRANIMQKLGVRTLADLVRTVLLQPID